MTDPWVCEECRAEWTHGQGQCNRCGNRTREPASDAVSVVMHEWRAEVEALHARLLQTEAENERLRAALTEVRDLHQPMWASEQAKAAGKEPWVCETCGVADGGWPCSTRITVDEALRKDTP